MLCSSRLQSSRTGRFCSKKATRGYVIPNRAITTGVRCSTGYQASKQSESALLAEVIDKSLDLAAAMKKNDEVRDADLRNLAATVRDGNIQTNTSLSSISHQLREWMSGFKEELYKLKADRLQMSEVKEDLTKVKEDVTKIKEELTKVKEDVTKIKEDVTKVKEELTKVTARPGGLEVVIGGWTEDDRRDFKAALAVLKEELVGFKAAVNALSRASTNNFWSYMSPRVAVMSFAVSIIFSLLTIMKGS